MPVEGHTDVGWFGEHASTHLGGVDYDAVVWATDIWWGALGAALHILGAASQALQDFERQLL